jgi:hypothetical protein
MTLVTRSAWAKDYSKGYQRITLDRLAQWEADR